MKVLVVYESIYGNTQQVAEAIGKALGERYEVSVAEVGEVKYEALDGVDLLVVGGPTHMLGMSRGSSRERAREAIKEREPVSKSIGVRDWLDQLPGATNTSAAAFDTRAHKIWHLPMGAAAKGIASRLEARGYKLVADPEGFFIQEAEGPLDEGELERAAQWGRSLVERQTKRNGK
jgi:flavodoxin